MNGIDFVLLWVDGSDPAWREEFLRARKAAGRDADASVIRYRDWRTLRYWFRAVERFAPWVNRVHFITWGHLPPWLDTRHPKLHIVNHRDYLPAEYLPTFNSNTLELNIGRIGGLAEKFVLFNDDTYLTRPCRPDDFFRTGGGKCSGEAVPCDMARLSLVQASSVGHIVYNDLALINALHTRKALNRHLGKWLSPKYGAGNLLKTLTLLPWSFFPGFYDPHLPQPYLKRQFLRAWELWPRELDASCRHTFREPTDLSHWLIRYDMLCRGEFAPRSLGDCRLLNLTDSAFGAVCRDIERGRWRMVCLNDSTDVADFDGQSRRLQEAFEKLLPDPSSYER